LFDLLRQEVVEEEDRKPEGEQGRRVAGAPGEPEFLGAASSALPAARGECRHSEVVRVARVAQSEENGDCEHDPDRGAVGESVDSLIEAEYRIPLTACGPVKC